jgi:16S rRNA (guanine966-N2)-methyltransferase
MSGAGRVIAGSARGIRLDAPGDATRPFGDRVKQTLFAIVEPGLRGARVLDLFAGSGAAGIEALSRGAASATFVERDRDAVRAIESNLARTRLADRAVVVRAEAIGWLDRQARLEWQLVIVDPPYADVSAMRQTLEILGRPGVVARGGRVVAKHFWREPPPEQIGLLASDRRRRFGQTALTFYRPSCDLAADVAAGTNDRRSEGEEAR